MRISTATLALAALCFALSSCATGSRRPENPAFCRVYDAALRGDGAARAAWSAYCDVLQRGMIGFYWADPEGHHAISFELELEARRALVAAYLDAADGGTAGRGGGSSYLGELAAIEAAGCLEEYVYVELGAGDWPEPEGLDLAGYREFMDARLPGHVPRAQALVLKERGDPDGRGALAGGTRDEEAVMGEWTPDERTTVELSFLSMAGFLLPDSADAAEAASGLIRSMLPRQEIVWGPAAHQPPSGGSAKKGKPTDALVLVCRDLDTGAYNVVLRGTNPVSAIEWMSQDFQVKDRVPWRRISPGNAPDDAMVSEGSAAAVSLRLGLCPEPGFAGEGRTLGRELVRILERSEGRCVMRFTGHSLGGLLASALALWLVDRLEADGRADLAARLELEVYSYAAPTAGNRSFAGYLESRLPRGALRRYACGLDIAPIAWDYEAMRAMPRIYLPGIRMDALSAPLYTLGMALAKDRGYAQPGEKIDVPSRIVPAKGGSYLLEAAYQHSVPYLDMLLPQRKERILREVMDPLASLVSIRGITKVELRDLYGIP